MKVLIRCGSNWGLSVCLRANSARSAGFDWTKKPTCTLKPSRKRRAVPLLGLVVVSIPLLACGPWFPNRLLDGGDEAVLVPPYADFFREIERMQLVSSPHVAKPLTNKQTHAEQTEDADLEDLR